MAHTHLVLDGPGIVVPIPVAQLPPGYVLREGESIAPCPGASGSCLITDKPMQLDGADRCGCEDSGTVASDPRRDMSRETLGCGPGAPRLHLDSGNDADDGPDLWAAREALKRGRRAPAAHGVLHLDGVDDADLARVDISHVKRGLFPARAIMEARGANMWKGRRVADAAEQLIRALYRRDGIDPDEL